jgi:hypothetical protein
MSTIATSHAGTADNAIDRWIYVFMAVFFIAITLTGFIPDSLAKLAAVEAGQRPPFPLALHAHSVLMGAFLLLLLVQTILAATGQLRYHQKLGISAVVLAPAIVIAGFILVPTMYQQIWQGMQAAPAEVQAEMQGFLRFFDNIMLFQIRVGIVFSVSILIALKVRKTNPGIHKRMMFLAIAPALAAAFDRMMWLPHSLPESPVSPDLYVLFAVAPMFLWDLVRNRSVHTAYWIWLGLMVPSSILIHILWDTEWWHAVAPQLAGL